MTGTSLHDLTRVTIGSASRMHACTSKANRQDTMNKFRKAPLRNERTCNVIQGNVGEGRAYRVGRRNHEKASQRFQREGVTADEAEEKSDRGSRNALA